jgi:hypothetical protein
MKRFFSMLPGFLVLAGVLHAAPAPDFWYVVPGGESVTEADASRLVQGIVIPTKVRPTIQTTPAGSAITWRRPDGGRQSFVIQGMSSFTFEPGPIADTTHVNFKAKIIYERPPHSCCSCASWLNSVESLEMLACVPGCNGCGCEGCVCSPGLPCPIEPYGRTTLVAHGGSGERLTFAKSFDTDTITLDSHESGPARFSGCHLTATMSESGVTEIHGAESITLPGAIENRGRVTGDKAFYAWSTPSAALILEQPRSKPAPSFHDGTIEFNVPTATGLTIPGKRPTLEPRTSECSVCGTHPNSQADLEIYDCVPGTYVCYRCITWTC